MLHDLRRQIDAPVSECVDEPGPQAGAAKRAAEPSVLVDASPEIEAEDVEQRDDIALHPLDLCDVRDPPGAVLEPGLVHDQVDGRGYLLPDRALRQFHL